MTRADHPTGTDRVAEVAASMPDARLIVNLQGDEPELSGEALDLVVSLLEADPDAPMATLATPIRDEAVYPRPLVRQGRPLEPGTCPLLLPEPDPAPPRRPARPRSPTRPAALLHLGLYAYPPRLPARTRRAPPIPPRSDREARTAPSARGRPRRSPSGSSRSGASASTRPKTTAASSPGGEPQDHQADVRSISTRPGWSQR